MRNVVEAKYCEQLPGICVYSYRFVSLHSSASKQLQAVEEGLHRSGRTRGADGEAAVARTSQTHRSIDSRHSVDDDAQQFRPRQLQTYLGRRNLGRGVVEHVLGEEEPYGDVVTHLHAGSSGHDRQTRPIASLHQPQFASIRAADGLESLLEEVHSDLAEYAVLRLALKAVLVEDGGADL